MKKPGKIDRPLLWIVIALVLFGFTIFISASLGLAAKQGPAYSSIILTQLILGVGMGSVACFVASKIHFMHWRKWSFWLFIAALLGTLLVFVPGLGLEAGGAKRWIILGPLSLQPAEVLKIAFVLYFATWLTTVKDKVADWQHGLLPFIIIAGVMGMIMLAQPDTDTYIVMLIAGTAMYLVAGGKWRHLGILALIGLIGLGGLIMTRPYVKDRIITFINPAADPLSSGYQIQQSLIAIGSGGVFGRGFGHSLQKFNFLPEPIGDSIFAVAAEEFGMVGSLVIIALFMALTWRGLQIAARSSNPYAGLVMIGLITLIVTQSFMNIAAMLGLIPLSGLPLLFISHGGTALFFTLFATGIMFNISRFQKQK